MTSIAHALRAKPAIRGFRRTILALPRLFALRRTRQSLLGLDDHLLQDIGLTRELALAEAARPIWDAPDHWQA